MRLKLNHWITEFQTLLTLLVLKKYFFNLFPVVKLLGYPKDYFPALSTFYTLTGQSKSSSGNIKLFLIIIMLWAQPTTDIPISKAKLASETADISSVCVFVIDCAEKFTPAQEQQPLCPDSRNRCYCQHQQKQVFVSRPSACFLHLFLSIFFLQYIFLFLLLR